MRAKFVNENIISFERNRDPKKSLNIGQIVANRDPNRRLHNFSMAFPELRFPYRSESTLHAPGSHPKWQIINGSIKDPKDNLSVEERAEKYLDWFKQYTDFDIVEIETSFERSYHEWGDPNKPKHTDQMIAIRMRNKEDMTNESANFERNKNPHKSLGIGKYRPHEFTFKDYEGDTHTIKVQDNCFKLFDMEVCLEFKEDLVDEKGEIYGDTEKYAVVYVDGQESDMNVFHMSPAEYEFFVPDKPIIEINGKYGRDPNTENWSKTKSAYGYPLVDKEDKKKLKEMQEKYGYWHVSNMDYTRTNKNPFAAVAEMVAFTY